MARTAETVTYKGETRTYAEWEAVLGIDRYTLRNRIIRGRWDVERAFTEPVNDHKARHMAVPVKLPDIRPKCLTLVEASIACKLAGMDYGRWHYLCEVLGVIEPPTAEEIAANTCRKPPKRLQYIKKDWPVTAYDLEGRPVMTYPSIEVAARALGKNTRWIYACSSGRCASAYGYQWRYGDDPPPGARLKKEAAPRTAPKTEKVCPICGTVFEGNKKEKLCSEACRIEAHKRRVRENDKARRAAEAKNKPKTKRCRECGGLFEPDDPKKLYCSQECRGNARRRKERERWARRQNRKEQK